ncbi:unnamed protein product [Spodoptera exigua]|nr:unnamed protein product [Spodoptera exigua]
MAALKTTLVLLLIAFAMLASVGAVRVGPCDQVCSRIDAEKDECCRAHGYSGYNSCRGVSYTAGVVAGRPPAKQLLIPVTVVALGMIVLNISFLWENHASARTGRFDLSVSVPRGFTRVFVVSVEIPR